MNLGNKKKLAAQIFDVGKKRVFFDPSKLDEIKEAITNEDIRSLVKSGAINIKNKKGITGFTSKKNLLQKRKGRRKGKGSRKGRGTARTPSKKLWMTKIRIQREILSALRNKNLLEPMTYQLLRNKCKGGFFRSKRHLKLYINENNLIKK